MPSLDYCNMGLWREKSYSSEICEKTMNMNVCKCKKYDHVFRIDSKITVSVEGHHL